MWVDSLLDRSGSAVPPGTVQLCASTCLPCLVAFFPLPKMCHIFLAGRVRPPQGAAVARALVAADVPHSARPGHAARGHAAQLVPWQLHLLPQRQPERAAPADGARCNSSSSIQVLLVAAGRVWQWLPCASHGAAQVDASSGTVCLCVTACLPTCTPVASKVRGQHFGCPFGCEVVFKLNPPGCDLHAVASDSVLLNVRCLTSAACIQALSPCMLQLLPHAGGQAQWGGERGGGVS